MRNERRINTVLKKEGLQLSDITKVGKTGLQQKQLVQQQTRSKRVNPKQTENFHY